MTITRPWRRLASRILAVACVGLGVSALSAVPAQAAYSSPEPIYLQVYGQNSQGYITYVGKATGTVQFDSSNTRYYLNVVVCQQSSYSFPNFTLSVNGAGPVYPVWGDGLARPECPNTRSGAAVGEFASSTPIYNITVCIQGVYFTQPVQFPKDCQRPFDNPFN